MSRMRSLARTVLLVGSMALALVGCGGGDLNMVESYGQERLQVGEWYLPEGGPHPVVVLVHGGCFQPDYNRHLEDNLAQYLQSEGFAVWNIDYRPPAVASFPATFEDVSQAVDHLPKSRFQERLDLERVALVGHSAGGHLALWAGSEGVGDLAPPALRPRLVVAQSPLADMTLSAELGVCAQGVGQVMDGTPQSSPANYLAGDPTLLTPDTPMVVLHGQDDQIVPLEVSQSFVSQQGPTRVRLVEVPGDHFSHLETDSEATRVLLQKLTASLKK